MLRPAPATQIGMFCASPASRIRNPHIAPIRRYVRASDCPTGRMFAFRNGECRRSSAVAARQALADRPPPGYASGRPGPRARRCCHARRQAPADAGGGQDRRADALTVPTALATARARSPPASSPTPLEWRLPRTTAANAAAQDNPAPAARWRCAASRPEPGPSHPAWTSSPRRSAAPCAISPAPPSSTTTCPRPGCRAKRHLRRSAGTARLGRRRNRTPGNPACPTASTARTKSTSATTTKFSLRYSDDGHIARELGEPPSAGPAHNISGPRCRGQAGYPRVSTRAGPGSHSPARARAGFGPGRVRAGPGSGRRAVAVEARPGPARAGPRVGRGPITTDARPVRQPGTMNAAPGEPLRARNLSGCQDQPPDLLLLWRRGAAAVMSAS